MFHIKAKMTPSFLEAFILIILIIAIMTLCIAGFKSVPHMPILIAILLLMAFGLYKKVSYKDLESGLVEGASAGMSAIFIFFFIGTLISSWMMSGTIPTLIYLGFETITPHFFYAVVFIVTCIIGIAIGSSLTTTATAGVAFIGMASAMDISLAITAGAIVSGAFFGDKMSPLSDTCNLSSTIMGVDLFEHIKNMCWTTIPALILSLILYAILSPSKMLQNSDKIATFKNGLIETGMIHWYTLIPLVVLMIMALKKVPAILTLAVSTIVAIAVSYFHHYYGFGEVLNILFNGYTSHTGIKDIDSLLSRGGINSMMFTIGLIVLALSMGGLLFTLGIIQTLLSRIEKLFKSVGSVITGAALTAISINTLIGEQYLSILLTGQAFQSQFQKVGLKNKNLARVAEDAGTVVNPLVPWSVCGIFITNVLAVTTWEYLPFAFFCLLSPILTVIAGWTGKTLTYIDKAE